VEQPIAAEPARGHSQDPAILGEGSFRYRVERGWAKLPSGWTLREVAGVAVAPDGLVYVFNRGAHPMLVFDRDGTLLRNWGEGVFCHPHGIDIGPDGAIYCTDDGDHTVRRMSPDGRVQLEIGVPGRPAPFMGGAPFNRCTHTALSPQGDIYVSDGYGNASIHQYAPDGRWIRSWGRPGSGPGEFNLPHNIACDADGWIHVADRENHRIQVFDGKGRYETQWNNLHRPSAFCLVGGTCPCCLVGELGPYLSVNRRTPNLGPRISILDRSGKLLARLGQVEDPAGVAPGQFLSPHGIAMDARGDIYVGEVGISAWPSLFPDRAMPEDFCALQKLVRLDVP
jgi:hypothetical protein